MAGRFSVETVFKAVDDITKPFKKMQQRVRRGSEKMAHHINQINVPLTKLTKGMAKLGSRALVAGTGALTAGITAATAAMVGLNRATSKNVQLAKSVNASAGFVENLAGAIRPAGFEVDNVIDLIEEMNNKLGESAGLKEITPVTESLAILGLKFRDIKKLKPEDQFKAITDAALKMKDAQKAAAAADILMGGEANKLIGILRTQGKTLDEVIKKQQALNFITDEGRAGAVAFDAEITRTKRLISTLAFEIAGLVGGGLTPLLAKMSAYIVANKALIKTRILEFFDKMQVKAKQAWEWLNEEGRLKNITRTLSDFASIMVKTVGFLAQHGDKVAILVGGLFALNGILTTVTASMALLNVVMLANPVVLITTAVIALIAAVAALVAYRDEVSEFLKGFAPDWLVDWLMSLPNALGQVIDLLKAAYREAVILADKVQNLNPVGRVKQFFGFEDEQGSQQIDAVAGRGMMISPQERTARTIEESRTTSTAELTIRDETGRGELSSKKPAPGIALNLAGSGGF